MIGEHLALQLVQWLRDLDDGVLAGLEDLWVALSQFGQDISRQ